jgi:hypothetical protein
MWWRVRFKAVPLSSDPNALLSEQLHDTVQQPSDPLAVEVVHGFFAVLRDQTYFGTRGRYRAL